jgi:hypothetical protein
MKRKYDRAKEHDHSALNEPQAKTGIGKCEAFCVKVCARGLEGLA